MFINEKRPTKSEMRLHFKYLTNAMLAFALFMGAAMLTANDPAHQSDCVGDTMTCSQEVGK